MFVLRSRVEQQSDLIMMLKTRNDELSTEIDGLKSSVRKAGLENTKLTLAKDKVVKQLNTLQDRFDTLAKQHQQMIEIKDEHKTARKLLQGQVDVLTKKVQTITETLEEEHKSEKDSLRTQLGEQRLLHRKGYTGRATVLQSTAKGVFRWRQMAFQIYSRNEALDSFGDQVHLVEACRSAVLVFIARFV